MLVVVTQLASLMLILFLFLCYHIRIFLFYSCVVNGKTLLYALVIPAAICMIVIIVLFVIGIIGVLKTKCEINNFNQSQSNVHSDMLYLE